jgi:ABC-type uncharacterized transport system substrate-binding protein
MDRRAFLGTLGLLAAPHAAEAQPAGKVHRIGILTLGPAGSHPSVWWQPFIDGLRELNYVEGHTLAIAYAGADANPDRLPELAVGLVKAKVDLIVTTGHRETLAARRATSSIPIVFTVVHDPVGQGVVTNLARPEANVTGLTTHVPGFYQKCVELLHEAAPSAKRFAYVANPNVPRELRQEVVHAGRELGIDILMALVAGPAAFDAALAGAKRDGAAGIVATHDPVTITHAQRLVQLALRHRLPGIYPERSFVEAGGLMSYSANSIELRRRAAHYVDRLLKGAKPADLPIERPTKFELAINLRTAKALGLTIPPSLLARADQVIE